MKKKLCCIMSVLLVLCICVPGGVVQAVAAEPAAQAAAQSQVTDAAQIASVSEDSPQVSQTQSLSEGAVNSDEEAQPASGQADDEETSLDSTQADVTRGSPAEEPAVNNLAAAIAKAILRAPVSGSIITSASLSTTHFNSSYSSAQLVMNFALPDGEFHSGDISTIQLPVGFKFVADYDFDVKSSDGATVARAHIDAQAGTMTLTYTNYVESHSGVTGSITASVTTNRDTIGDFGKKQFNLNVDGTIVPVGEVVYEKWKGDSPDEVIAKWGNASNSADGTIAYTIRVNGKGDNISDAVVSDALKSPGMSYVEDSFTVTRGTISLNPDSGSYEMSGGRDVTDQFPVEFSSDKSSFSISLGDIGTDGFYVRYKVKLNHDPVNQEKFQNTVGLAGSNGTVDNSYTNTVVWQTASGEANGYNYTIAINKTDETGAPLAGAVFSVVRDSSGAEVGTITTGADGAGSLGGLLRDAYTVRETTPPEGYTAAADVHVSADDLNNDAKTATLAIADRKIETVSIPCVKAWDDGNDRDGTRPASVTVSLLADGRDVAEKAITSDDGWMCSFDGLAKYDASDGHEIVYSVQEIDVAEGYTASVTGDAVSGFTVTNTKEDVPGTPGDPQDNSNSSQDGPDNPQDKSSMASSALPKTGDDATVSAVLLIAALAACAAGAAGWRRASAERRRLTGHARHLKK